MDETRGWERGGGYVVLNGCVHCVTVSACNLAGWYGSFFCFFSCDVWSVCSHEVRLEEKGVAGDEAMGKTLEKKGYVNTGLAVFRLLLCLMIVFSLLFLHARHIPLATFNS